ncbi:MAG TPA: tRNA (N6-isopentenyl adenosine(37)-C2)-methylthiotransferase MiaB [Bacteroidales bacterium]|nr:tRNA (N6-isopentenyl adenosine(37)-C2)-methylthiotransferase MiaB [Bacteroidales bacterium]HRZ48324.1 tRNA (N6-isopentenyl adenosine(37)-C2)-methylthiotransferase MiaB [Bacteroidales bacterium]
MKLFIETFGCQMNFSDSEVVASVMNDQGYELCGSAAEADLVFINTCSIRENAEQRVRKRLRELKGLKKKHPGLRIGILGCMAERLREQLFDEEPLVDLIAGPDSYRKLPEMLQELDEGRRTAQVLLSEEETYADLEPVRYGSNKISAYISIMRGCQNFCSYCVVPYTRGRERSRDPESIVKEAERLVAEGYREVTLLGQNVNSYQWQQGDSVILFPELLTRVAAVSDQLRVRFATSHPKDLSDELIDVIAATPNICNHIHLPVQSGSDAVLKRMNRRYTRAWYLGRIAAIREKIPDAGLSTDLIAGFCGETEEDHRLTLDLMEQCRFDFAFMFAYSQRPGTRAAEKLEDDVPDMVKKGRLHEIITLQQRLSHTGNRKDVGKTFEVLVEGTSRKSPDQMFGRNGQNKVIVFPSGKHKPGDYVEVKVVKCTSATLIGEALE